MTFKNEEKIKDMIMEAKRHGKCDGYGRSVRTDIDGHRVFAAKPRFSNSETKTDIYRDGKMVLKNG